MAGTNEQMPLDTPELTSQIPLQGSDQSVDVNTPQPEQMPQAADTPQFTPTIPSETAPNNPDVYRDMHENWMHRALDRAATLLGGDQTIHITKDPDGNVTMTHDSSTTKEKWGRIAQAVLVGAAAGFQNSQGPGGLGKAAAAGVQTGAQLPQQREQQAQQQVDFDNKQLMAKANRIHLTQQTAMEAAQLNLENMKIDQSTADAINKSTEDYAGRPGAIDYGVYDPKQSHGVIDFSKQNPGAMADFLGKNNRTAAVVWKPDGKLHVIGYNASDDERWNDKPVEIPYNDSDADGKPKISYKTAGPGTHKQGQLDLTRAAVQAEQLRRLNIWSEAQKKLSDAERDKDIPKNYEEAFARAANAPDVVTKQKWTNLGNDLYKKAQGLRAVNQVNVGTVPPGTTPAQMIQPGGKFAPDTVSGVNAQKLASGDLLLSELPKRMAKGAATPQEMVAAAEQYSQQQYGLGYSPTMIENEKKLFDNIKTQGTLDGIDKMVGVDGAPGYLDTVVSLGLKAVGPNSSAPWNDISLAVRNKFGEQTAKNFNTALGEVQRSLPSLIGNPLLGGSDSDLKQKKAEEMFGQNITAGNLLSTADTLKGLLNGSKDSLTRNNRFLQRRYGLKGPYAGQSSPTQGGGGAPANPGPAPNPPAKGGVDWSKFPAAQ